VNSFLFDSNVFIYHLNGSLPPAGVRLLREGLLAGGGFSVISRIEVLGFPQPAESAASAKRLFAALTEYQLTADVVERTVHLRRQHKIKIPDAVIAATALVHQLPLVTANIRDFEKITGLPVIDPLQGKEGPS
jgi:predicted nucleic acid-binding protein